MSQFEALTHTDHTSDTLSCAGVADLTWPQIREMDAGSHFFNSSENKASVQPRTPTHVHRVPLLREVLSAFHGRAHIHLVSELRKCMSLISHELQEL